MTTKRTHAQNQKETVKIYETPIQERGYGKINSNKAREMGQIASQLPDKLVRTHGGTGSESISKRRKTAKR